MCGIFGISGNDNAAALTHLGLYSLQHRGQESAGIVAVDDGHVHAIRAMGLVSDQFSPEKMATLTGPMAMGHTRYSTAGSSTIENAQPALVRFKGGHIALAHNGNITNATEIRAALEEEGSIFSSTADSEVVVHRLAKSGAGRPEEKLAEALTGVEGAYSLLVMIGDTLVAARDPYGWRPLVMGKLGDAVVFASETCAMDIVGATTEREVQPGEIVAVAPDGSVRSIQRPPAPDLHRCVFEYVYFARPDSRVFGGSVDRARRALGRKLAQEHPVPGADFVFSVPDSSNSAALGFAEETGLPYELALIRNHYVGRTFIQPTQAGRDAKVKVKYNAVREILEGKSVVMVDDSIVRGTTTRGLVALVRAAGAREVHMRVSSPPITGPCYYGIDTPDREQLIAAQNSVAEIAKIIGVDSLGYISLEGMLGAVPGGPNGFCHACFSGQYPTKPPSIPKKLRMG
ncbi:MAG TPA: amidophosphoribosyltransferase [Gemmatimonadaceae bacterium]|jgi:amidophosphoribosyltransferase|nr:amidophosphoribosyltransferase [Gemmatimonadaceae bacterium]